MRCRRLCEKKGTGKSHVDSSVSEIYKNGGPGREVLEMALLECLAKYGTGRQNYKKIKAIQCHQSTYIGPIYSPLHGGSINILYYISIYIYIYMYIYNCPMIYQMIWHPLSLLPQAEFVTKCKHVRERMESRESEQSGVWLTEEAMRKSGKWSPSSIKNITSYCKKFPENLCRLSFTCHAGLAHSLVTVTSLGSPLYMNHTCISLSLYIYIYLFTYIYIYIHM